MKGKKSPGIVAASGICALAAAFLIALSLWPGLRKSEGFLGLFRDQEGRGFTLRLQAEGRNASKDQAWGFFEWPEKRIYGFVSFAGGREGVRKGKVTSGTGKGSEVELHDTGTAGQASIVFSGQGLPEGNMSLIYAPERGSPALISFSARGSHRFRVDHLADTADGGYPFLDARLRRGESPGDYAMNLSGRTDRSQSLMERQYWLGSHDGRYSIATERSLSGARARDEYFFSFTTLDAATGKAMTEQDLFKPGWHEAFVPFLNLEAQRILGGGSLKSHALFDDSIKPASDFFFCSSGLGFHYDRYELGPYSLGDFTFVLPWAEIAEQIK